MGKQRTEPERQHAAILMLDVKGYSRLPEWALGKFFAIALPRIDQLLTAARYKNSWGDGVIAVFDKDRPHVKAAEVALEIIEWFSGMDWRQELNIQEAARLQVRIALNCGILLFGPDPIKGGEGCAGKPIHVCARIEPVVDPGQAWCTDLFATQLREEAGNEHPRVGVRSLGVKDLAKDFGSYQLFELVHKQRAGVESPKVYLGPDPAAAVAGPPAGRPSPKVPLYEMTAEQLHELINRAMAGPLGELQRQLAPYLGAGRGVFGERSDHFKDEKTAIAQFLIASLRHRFADGGRGPDVKYRLFLDSGTTVYAVFEELIREGNWSFFRNLPIEIVTNNVPGFMLTLDDALLKHDRTEGGAGLARRIKILPGAPVARYRAIVSEETIAYLAEKYPQQSGVHNVVVTTGNFARHDARAIYARDTYHLRFKKALVGLADEVWTLLPLGKILPPEWNLDRLNSHVESGTEDDDRYDTVEVPEAKPHRVVTTSRRPGEPLYNYFERFKWSTGDLVKKAKDQLHYLFVPTEGADVAFNMTEVARRTGMSQLELEFPHAWMSREDVRDRLRAAFSALGTET